VEIFPQALDALASIKSSQFRVILVTNQAAIAKGLISPNMATKVNDRLLQIIQENSGRIDGIYMCPHQAEDHCQCRKPKPGLLLQARDELGIDLSRSIMIGDALSDIRAGKSAGVQKSILVLTGRGKEQSQLPEAESLQPFLIYTNLQEALTALLQV
jgi:D-glycero-D-manno-heptose 1,7-bisphosphate phosphatase